MDFDLNIFGLIASFILTLKTSVYLIVSPYKTMRKLAESRDLIQAFFIFVFIGLYFIFAEKVRTNYYQPIFLFSLTLVNFFLTTLFFSLIKLVSAENKKINFPKFIMLFSYSLIPTLIWFSVNSILYVLLPPPRTPSFWGKGFSIIYISFSIAVLAWKIIVEYLAVRYSTEFKFFRTLYSLILYLVAIIPYAFILYFAKIFRIPFL